MAIQRRVRRTNIGLAELYDTIYPNNSEEYHTFLGTNKDIEAARANSYSSSESNDDILKRSFEKIKPIMKEFRKNQPKN